MNIQDSSNKNKWILRPKPQDSAKVRLFCFPYAGSSGIVTYKFLVDMLPNSIEVCPIELPGRGLRINENLINRLDEVVWEISKEIKDFFDLPFIFFGHSMGALISYELAKMLESQENQMPYKLYISAHRAPFHKREGKIIHKLEESEFIEELNRMNGIAQGIFENQELMELMLPIIKNDFELCETYNFNQKNKLHIPITTFGGVSDDDVTKIHLSNWKDLTDSNFEIQMFEGDHFYFLKNKNDFVKKFTAMLSEDLIHKL